LERDRAGCASQGGYSDRRIVRVVDGDYYELDDDGYDLDDDGTENY
jgi:hypothetical protein